MKLVDDIIDLSVDNKTSISVILRKCLVLAHELKNQRLQTWVERELDGYKKEDEVPPYRRIQIVAKGIFFGPGGGQINDQPLNPFILKEEHRYWATEAIFFEPIGGIPEDIKDNFSRPWPPGLTTMYQSDFIRGYALNRAWQDIPGTAITALIDAVRNKVLRFALEIKEELGATGDDAKAIPQEKIEQSVINIIYGGNIMIAGTVDNSAVQQGGAHAIMDQSSDQEKEQ